MLKLIGINKKYNKVPVLNGVDLNVDKGSVVCIIGSSGSGKTTLLRNINFLEAADKGTIILDGNSIAIESAVKKDIKYIRNNTSMVFQQHNLFKNKNVLDNVTFPLIYGKKIKKEEAFLTAKEHLESVGMWNKKDAYPIQLSGGQQQRVSIARAIALKPKVILFDEPTSSLDPEMVGEVLEVIKSIVKLGITMLIVTHEINFAYDIADNVIFMDGGVVLEQGNPKQLFKFPKNPRTKQFLSRFNNLEYFI